MPYNDNDVLLAKAKNTKGHTGNSVYWDFLLQQLPLYGDVVDNRDGQFELAQRIVDFVEKENGGRFLELDDEEEWVVAEPEIALSKIRRALKEKWERENKKISSSKKQARAREKPAATKRKQSIDSDPGPSQRPKRSKSGEKPKPASRRDDDNYMVDLTEDVVDVLKVSRLLGGLVRVSRYSLSYPSRFPSLNQLIMCFFQEQKAPCRINDIVNELEAAREDVDYVCRSLSELGMIYLLDGDGNVSRSSDVGSALKALWWEYSGPYLKAKSWDIMPVSEKAPHKLRNEMSKVCREEAKLDAWISRLRGLKTETGNKDQMYVTPSDIFSVLSPDPATPDTTGRSKKKRSKSKRVPVLAVHAPFGSQIQTSTAISKRRRVDDTNCTNNYQLLVSCKNHDDQHSSSEGGGTAKKVVGRQTQRMQVHLFPEQGQGRTYNFGGTPCFAIN